MISMKRFFTLFLLFALPVLLVAQMSGVSLRSIARAFRVDPIGTNTIDPTQYGMGWSDSKFTLRTPPGNLQFATTGDPAEPVMTWPGRITAEHIDVTSMSLFTSVPATSESPGTVGQMAFDSGYFYVCTALNTWKRAALTTY
jgi:hypothetical protein